MAAEVKSFRLVVVDSRPLNEGLATLTALSHRVHCVVSEFVGITNSFWLLFRCVFFCILSISLLKLRAVLTFVWGGGGDEGAERDPGAAGCQQSAEQRGHARPCRSVGPTAVAVIPYC